jgi:uncharacterized protein (TIGR03790 family)
MTSVPVTEWNRASGPSVWRCVAWLVLIWGLGLGPEVKAQFLLDANENGAAITMGAPPSPMPVLLVPTPLQLPDPASSLRYGTASAVESTQALAPNSAVSSHPFHFNDPRGDPERLPAHLLVVYNQNDPDSKALALYYAAQRQIAADHVLGIACPTVEEITRAQYDETIREPIITYLFQKDWMARRSEQVRVGNRMMDLLLATRNDIWAMVLMRGVPLKIAPDPTREGSIEHEPELQTNAAAVDSELALLPIFGLPYGGFAPNPFYDAAVNGVNRAGPELATKIILVTRLDAPTVADVRRMIDDSLYAETHRLAGLAVIDSRGHTAVNDSLTSGDSWLRHSRDFLQQDGWTVKFDDKEEVIPASDPCNHVALYLGWYRTHAYGPWVTPPDRFERGAIAYHLHSFSASTLRDPVHNWVGPLLAHGAAASMGTVYEPYLALTPRLDIFTKRLLDGDSFAEAAYASERGLSWMVTVVGDPLYRPFRVPLEVALSDASQQPGSGHYDWLLAQQVQRQLLAGKLEMTTGALVQALDVTGAGGVLQEQLADLLEKVPEPAAVPVAEQAYKKAMALDSVPLDRIRVGLKLAQFYGDHSREERAEEVMRSLTELYPRDAPLFGVVNPLVPTSNPPRSLPVEK